MKRRAILSGVFLLSVAGQAGAVVMDTWTRLGLQFTNLTRAEATDTGVGVSTLNTSGGGAHLDQLSLGNGTPGLSLNTVLPVTDPVVSSGGIVSVRFTGVRAGNLAGPQGDPGVLAPISGAIASDVDPGVGNGLGTVPATGMLRLCFLVFGCQVEQPIDVVQTLNGVAQGGGVGGILTVRSILATRLSFLGAPYTVKTVSAFARTHNGGLQTLTERGFAHGPLSNTSSTGQVSGVVQVVTATRISTVGFPATYDVSGQFSRILVHFIPEPGLLLLLGSGAAGMLLLGRKRMRR
jgi:hypothetical protein